MRADGVGALAQFGLDLFEHGLEEVRLGREMVVQRAGRHAGVAGEIVDRRGREPERAEQSTARRDESLAGLRHTDITARERRRRSHVSSLSS